MDGEERALAIEDPGHQARPVSLTFGVPEVRDVAQRARLAAELGKVDAAALEVALGRGAGELFPGVDPQPKGPAAMFPGVVLRIDRRTLPHRAPGLLQPAGVTAV